MSRATSWFIAGLLVGGLLSSVAFALVLRITRGVHDGGGNRQQAIVLKLGHGLATDHPVHAAMLHMQQRLAEKSGGTLVMEIFPNAQLGSEDQTVEQVQRGELAMTKTSTGPLEAFVPEMKVFGLPYLFRDADHYWNTLDGPVGRELLGAGRDHGLIGLCWYDGGARSFYTVNRPIRSPADMAGGMAIRVQKSPMSEAMIRAMGGNPQPIPWGELYSALQTGVVKGAENNPPSYLSERHFEVAPHLSLDEHTRLPDVLLISSRIWDRLSLQQQQWVQEAAAESSVYQRELWAKRTQEALDELAAQTRVTVTIDRPDKGPFRAAVQPLYDQARGTPMGTMAERVRGVE